MAPAESEEMTSPGPTLTIRRLPKWVYDALRDQALLSNRSLEGQVRAILTEAAAPPVSARPAGLGEGDDGD